jgi:hypothetical protein
MDKKIIAVNGCSFTQELYLKPEYRWTNLIGCDVNLAHGGASNERIFSTSIEYLSQNRPDIFIVGWTTLNRGMSTTTRGSRVIINSNRAFDEETGVTLENFRKFYFSEVFNEFVNFKQVLIYMIHLQDYCRLKGIKLLYWNALMPSIDDSDLYQLAEQAYMSRRTADIEKQGIEHNKKILQDLISKLDRKIWIKKFWYGINDHCVNFKWLDDGHVAEEGSAHWGDLVRQYL